MVADATASTLLVVDAHLLVACAGCKRGKEEHEAVAIRGRQAGPLCADLAAMDPLCMELDLGPSLRCGLGGD